MQEKKLEMYGGLFGGLIPLIVLVGGSTGPGRPHSAPVPPGKGLPRRDAGAGPGSPQIRRPPTVPAPMVTPDRYDRVAPQPHIVLNDNGTAVLQIGGPYFGAVGCPAVYSPTREQ